jgi:4-phytase/acid phosphatase
LKKLARLFIFVVAATVSTANAVAGQPGSTQVSGERLKFVLILTRHGVRSPTWTNSRLDEYSKEAWPKWNVAPGMLTPHGKILMSIFGGYYRADLAAHGLLSPNGCSDAEQVYFYADTDQRTVETAHGLAEGMLPGCKVEVHSLGEGVQDALFHATGKVGKPDAQLALSSIAGKSGGDPAALLPAYELQLDLMQRALFACPTQACDTDGKKNLLAMTPSLAQSTGDHLVEIKGPLTTGATFAENFQLEYLEGMPPEQVGWGRIDERTVRSLMAIHTASSDLLQRTPYIARVQASNLLVHILRTLKQEESQKAVPGAVGPPGDKVVFLVGHDTNIANVAALLDLHWLVNGYQRDDAAPGGALVFELWQAAGKEDVVRIHYTVQRPDQMRNSLPLSPANPPGQAVVFIPACSQSRDGAPCGWSAFRNIVGQATDPAFAK